MKKLILAALAATVVATPVLAAPGYDRDGRGRYEQQRFDRHDRHDRFDRHDRNDRNQYRSWSRGQRFDSRYARNYRVIGNPRFYRLHDAPRGYRWVQSGNDALLVGITSGLIASVLANALN